MSSPGWYPDPSHEGRYRYWNGSDWTNDYVNSDGSAVKRSAMPWIWFAVAMVVVVGLLVILIYRPGSTAGPGARPDTNSARPTGSQWDETIPTDTPTEPNDPGPGTPVECPRHLDEDRSEVSADGRLHGGGLSVVPPDGWHDFPTYMPGVVDHNSMSRQIIPGWISSISVGGLRHSDGFGEPRLAAEQMMSCIASSSLFSTFTGRNDLLDEAIRLDGYPGWRITTEVFVSSPEEVDGDIVDVIVLDIGDPDQLAIYVSAATIDLTDNLEEVAVAQQTLRVEG